MNSVIESVYSPFAYLDVDACIRPELAHSLQVWCLVERDGERYHWPRNPLIIDEWDFKDADNPNKSSLVQAIVEQCKIACEQLNADFGGRETIVLYD